MKLFLAIVLVGALSAAETSPVSAPARRIREAVDTARALETVSRVYETDRWFAFPRFEDTAKYLKSRLAGTGITDVVIGGATADGKTQAGFWTMPLAWDVRRASLDVTAPEKIQLCDYAAVPSCLGMWSGATPARGIDAEIVDVRTTKWDQVRGKFVLTERNSASVKHLLVRNGALGAINAFTENPALPDGRQWINAWGDDGWGFTKTSTPLLSYSITPQQAERLRKLLASGQKVTAHAVAETRYYAGRYPWVTGILRGTDPSQEVLVLGHTSEQGAQDNATGVAAIIEALATLNRLIAAGKLQRPRRSIRILLMPEMYGSLSYLTEHADRTRSTVAAITVDTPAASYDLAGTEYTLYRNPHVAMSWTDELINRIAAACLPKGRPWHVAEHTTGTDAYLGEPTVGVPDVWLYSGTGVTTHHNSEDKPDTVDERSMRDLVSIVATYLWFTADAGPKDLQWLTDITLDRGAADMQAAASAAVDALATGNRDRASFSMERVRYFADRTADALGRLKRLDSGHDLQPAITQIASLRDVQLRRLRMAGITDSVPPGGPERASELIVRRKRIGTIPLDDLPREKWGKYPSGAWDKLVTIALYWCDGKRPLSEVIRLTEMEMDRRSDFDFVGYFEFLEKNGYVEFVR